MGKIGQRGLFKSFVILKIDLLVESIVHNLLDQGLKMGIIHHRTSQSSWWTQDHMTLWKPHHVLTFFLGPSFTDSNFLLPWLCFWKLEKEFVRGPPMV